MRNAKQKTEVLRKRPGPDTLSARELAFCNAYLLDANGTKAAIQAGYSENGASVRAVELLARSKVQAYISQRQNSQVQKLEATTDRLQQRILEELESLAFSNIEAFTRLDPTTGNRMVDFSTATPAQLRAITKIKNKTRTVYSPKGDVVGVAQNNEFSIADKYRGLEMLGKHIGMWKTEEQKIVVDVADRLLESRKRLLNVTQLAGTENEDTE